MTELRVRVKLAVALLAAALAAYGFFSLGPGSNSASYRARHVQLLASGVTKAPMYVQFQVISSTRGIIEGNSPHGGYEIPPFSREYWLHPGEKLTIHFIVGVNDIGNVVSCFVQTENGVAAHDRHVKKKETRGATPLDAKCGASIINI